VGDEEDLHQDYDRLGEGYTDSGKNIFCKVAPNVYGSVVWNLFNASFLAPRFLRSLLEL
jgi:hypothetical protein